MKLWQILLIIFCSVWSRKLWSLAPVEGFVYQFFPFSDQYLTKDMYAWFLGDHLHDILLSFAVTRTIRLAAYPPALIGLFDFMWMIQELEFVYFMLAYETYSIGFGFEIGDVIFALTTLAIIVTLMRISR